MNDYTTKNHREHRKAQRVVGEAGRRYHKVEVRMEISLVHRPGRKTRHNLNNMRGLTAKQAQLWNHLHSAFEADPLEGGTSHPAEQIIAKALQSTENRKALFSILTVTGTADRFTIRTTLNSCFAGSLQHS